ncbi:hypothetical protein BIY24_01730 [Halobacteriovorax marinus]|uniref:GNAT family N-acetyltransferase n=1 Tax=Halobacteriovorax marinus TaxID=97084 RepID=UPI000BC2F2B7|nr:GNAT family protein [Halobacteriovorax marinus]ATH06702.1 hypothetical protein BIY24_01730 [Halobacteriovorax marinus]
MNVSLREISRKDIPSINNWRINEELVGHLGAPFRYIDQEIDEKWYDAYLQNRGTEVRLAIEVVEGDIKYYIGNAYLTSIDQINRSSIFSIFIGDKNFWGRGIGSEVTHKVLSHAFDDLNLHRVCLYVLGSNLRARSMYEKIGFKLEGTMRKAVFKGGFYSDLHFMGILKEEFLNGDD